MTPHDHSKYVPGCYRCELSRDEAHDAVADERDELLSWAEAQCRLRAREYEQASGMAPESISDDEAWALYGPPSMAVWPVKA